MRVEILKDNNGSLIGRIEFLDNGDQILRDFSGTKKAEYRSHENITYDKNGNKSGSGNLLARFI